MTLRCQVHVRSESDPDILCRGIVVGHYNFDSIEIAILARASPRDYISSLKSTIITSYIFSTYRDIKALDLIIAN